MERITSKEMAERWGLSVRRVNLLCAGGRIPGAKKTGGCWLIPEGTEKPADARRKEETPKPEEISAELAELREEPAEERLSVPVAGRLLLVKDLFSDDLFPDWRAAGGTGGFENEIDSLNMMESPDIANWIRPGQFIVSTGYCIRDDVNTQKRLIRDMSKAGCAGFAIKIMRFFTTIPQHMIDTANECGLPLIEIPDRYNISEVMERIQRRVYAEQLGKMRISAQLAGEFTAAAFDGGEAAVVRTLGTMLKKGIMLSDVSWRRLESYSDGSFPLGVKELATAEAPLFSHEGERFTFPHTEKTAVGGTTYRRDTFLIEEAGTPLGYLSLWSDRDDISDYETAAMETACTVLGHMIAGKERAENAVYSQREIFLTDEYFNRVQSEKVALRRAASTGMNTELRYRAMIVRRYSEGEPCVQQELYPAEIAFIRALIRSGYGNTSVIQIDNAVVIVMGLRDPKDVSELERLKNAVKERLDSDGMRLLFAVGNPYPVSRLHTSCRQAKEAVNLWERDREAERGDFVLFSERMTDSVLITVDPKKQDIVHSHFFGRLAEYDEEHHAELSQTLGMFLECGCNISKTARGLFIHRNTLLFRLEKIKEVLEIDFEQPADLLILQIAHRLQRYRRE